MHWFSVRIRADPFSFKKRLLTKGKKLINRYIKATATVRYFEYSRCTTKYRRKHGISYGHITGTHRSQSGVSRENGGTTNKIKSEAGITRRHEYLTELHIYPDFQDPLLNRQGGHLRHSRISKQ